MANFETVSYIAKLERDGEGYFISVPDFPDTVTGTDRWDDVERYANEVLSLAIYDMLENGEPLPEPTKGSDLGPGVYIKVNVTVDDLREIEVVDGENMFAK